MNETPPVSCMCLTYGRTHLLGEAIQSFLLQDYPGVKELIILNDLPSQQIRCDHPLVKVINVSKRFRTVGEKRNACAGLATHDVLFVWDDDDICLTHRISYCLRMMDPAKGYFKPKTAWVLSNGVLKGPDRNTFHGIGCWTRSLFDRAGGYTHTNSGQDVDLEMRFEKLIGRNKDADVRPAENYYIYRWAGTGSFHLSGYGVDKPGNKPGSEKVGDYVAQKAKAGGIPAGEIVIEPHWKCDYAKIVADHLTKQLVPAAQ